jgi:hypothetical protein
VHATPSRAAAKTLLHEKYSGGKPHSQRSKKAAQAAKPSPMPIRSIQLRRDQRHSTLVIS